MQVQAMHIANGIVDGPGIASDGIHETDVTDDS